MSGRPGQKRFSPGTAEFDHGTNGRRPAPGPSRLRRSESSPAEFPLRKSHVSCCNIKVKIPFEKGNYNLLCVAHPDDETIFFGGLLQQKSDRPWLLVCAASDGSEERRRQFHAAAQRYNISEVQWWGFLDQYDKRLPILDLVSKFSKLPEPFAIYTHSILGEYGHPHHQDVSFAVHRAFPAHERIFSVAYNCYPETSVHLTKEHFALKCEILTTIYQSETRRFLNLLPATFVEGFVRLDFAEVQALYDFLTGSAPLPNVTSSAAQVDASGTSSDRGGSVTLKSYGVIANFLPNLRHLPRLF
ncbi:MAG: hypothetical protein C5B49_09810 [Bdellovibrio sp.]|nr:MAG: hypothetical protein C5B49_09810 [Bdellovibrio sp.]